jgi:hypothetical protein
VVAACSKQHAIEHILPGFFSLLGGGDDDPPTGTLLDVSLDTLHPPHILDGFVSHGWIPFISFLL